MFISTINSNRGKLVCFHKLNSHFINFLMNSAFNFTIFYRVAINLNKKNVLSYLILNVPFYKLRLEC